MLVHKHLKLTRGFGPVKADHHGLVTPVVSTFPLANAEIERIIKDVMTRIISSLQTHEARKKSILVVNGSGF